MSARIWRIYFWFNLPLPQLFLLLVAIESVRTSNVTLTITITVSVEPALLHSNPHWCEMKCKKTKRIERKIIDRMKLNETITICVSNVTFDWQRLIKLSNMLHFLMNPIENKTLKNSYESNRSIFVCEKEKSSIYTRIHSMLGTNISCVWVDDKPK